MLREKVAQPTLSARASTPADGDSRAVGTLARLRAAVTRPPNARPYLLGELIVVAFLLRIYDLVRGWAEVRKVSALHHGQDIMTVEGWLHVRFEHAVNVWSNQHHAVDLLASYWYQFGHISLTFAVLIWVWIKRPAAYRSARNALVMINVVALAVFLLYPVAPPRLLPGYTFIDSVANAGFGTTHGGPVTADQYGAMPSLHIGWAVWTAVVAYRLVKDARLAWVWLFYPWITLYVIVATGNHYVADAVVGLALALVTLRLTHGPHLFRRRPPD